MIQELVYCDHCNNPNEDYAHSDYGARGFNPEGLATAVAEGWVVLERRGDKTYPGVGGLAPMTLHDHRFTVHLCPECIKDPHCRAKYAAWGPERIGESPKNWEEAARAV